jgi:hypothetical protein
MLKYGCGFAHAYLADKQAQIALCGQVCKSCHMLRVAFISLGSPEHYAVFWAY